MPLELSDADHTESCEDDPWDAFLADDDERDPWPEPGDFWPDDETEDAYFSFTARPRKELPSCCH